MKIKYVNSIYLIQIRAIYPVLQKDLDLIGHVLVKKTNDPNVSFAPYLIKKP